MRTRSAPAEVFEGPPARPVSFDDSEKNPQKPTRALLQTLSIEELASIARLYGLDKLYCREDRQAAARMLPLAQSIKPPDKLKRIEKFLADLSWEQLVTILISLARRRMGNPPRDAGAEYFAWICEILKKSQLRHDAVCGLALCDADSVASWRMRQICSENGLAPWWDAVQARLGCGELVFLTGRPVPLLCDELTEVSQLVATCHVASASAPKSELDQLLQNCDVLYIGGKHDKSLERLKQVDCLGVTLIVLNVCSSEKLARQLITKGVRQVSYWPTVVHDPEAVKFGVSFVRNLFDHRIEEAFHKAKQAVCMSERAPRLLSSGQKVREELQVIDVILGRQRSLLTSARGGKTGHVGKRARVLPHTVMNGWVKVQIGETVVPWRVGHWCEAPPLVGQAKSLRKPSTRQICQFDSDLFADTQPDTEDENCTEHSENKGSTANASAAPLKRNALNVSKDAEDVEDTQYFLQCMTAAGRQISPKRPETIECEATQVEDCEDTLVDVDSQDDGQSCKRRRV